MKKNAFTMIEIVMVIVVIGILAAMALPRMKRDLMQQAADNVLSSIRYTQHLALVDNKHKFNKAKWQRRFWRIYFGTCEGKAFYAVGSDDNMDPSSNARVDFTESALDPANGKHLWAHDGETCNGAHDMKDISPSVLIGKEYNVVSVQPSGGCTNKYIGFDHLGRPYSKGFPGSTRPNNAGILSKACKLNRIIGTEVFGVCTTV